MVLYYVTFINRWYTKRGLLVFRRRKIGKRRDALTPYNRSSNDRLLCTCGVSVTVFSCGLCRSHRPIVRFLSPVFGIYCNKIKKFLFTIYLNLHIGYFIIDGRSITVITFVCLLLFDLLIFLI